MTSSTQRTAFVVSLALHAALVMWVEVRADARTPPVRAPARDAWSGNGIEVDAPPSLTDAARAAASPEVPREPSTAVPVAAPAVSLPREPREAARATPPRTSTPSAPTVATASAAAESEAAGRSSAGSTPGGGNPSPFGAMGLPAGVRHLPRAFARAVALANRGDAAWRTLPLGTVGEASVALPVEMDGALGALAFDDSVERDRLLPPVRRMLDNTVLLLASGRFSLDTRELSGGVMRVRVRVEIVEQSGLPDPDVDPNELNAIDYEPPLPGKPGHGAFLLNSGRRVVCWVTTLG